MLKFKKIPERESTKEVLERLKSQEKKQTVAEIRDGVPYLNIAPQKNINAERSTIPEYNAEQVLRQITNLERKMKEDSSNYLNLFYDLRKLEDKFLKAVDFIKANNIQVKADTLKEIESREGIISRRGKRSV